MFKFVYFIVLNYVMYQEFCSLFVFMARAAEIMTKNKQPGILILQLKLQIFMHW